MSLPVSTDASLSGRAFDFGRYQRSEFGFGDQVRSETLVAFTGTGGRILDVGCLDGTIGAMLLGRGHREVYGVDLSSSAVERALSMGVQARVGDLEGKLEFADGFFDAVVAGEIIEHIYNIDLFLGELRRVLKPGGTLALSTPNLAALGRRLLLLCNRNPHIEISFTGEAAGHIRYFVKGTLLAILAKHGFTVETLTSDVVNLNASGSLRLRRLATLVPTLGRCLIVKAVKR